MARKSFVLGIDGGGTKTLCLLADADGNILARREGGATNPHVVGIEAAARHLFKLIHEACEDARCETEELRSAVLGLAGAGRESDRRNLRETLGSLFAESGSRGLQIAIETDARIALEGSFAGGPGVVIIAGTGSIVIGKTQRDDVVQVGGWGRILGDEGSGYAIGCEAVKALALHMDGRGEATKLREVFARRFNWETRDQIIAAVYKEKFDLASLAPVVFETALANDVVSQRILQRAAALLVEQASHVIKKMGVLRKIGLVMAGGLIDHPTAYANVLHMKLIKLLPQVDIRPPVHSPAQGAVLMALDRLKRS